jgi:colicin import membrane protein
MRYVSTITTINDQIIQSIDAEKNFAMQVQTLLSEVVIKNTNKEHEHKLDLLKKENQARQDVYDKLHKQKLLHTQEEYQAEIDALNEAETKAHNIRLAALKEQKAEALKNAKSKTEITAIEDEYTKRRKEETKLYVQKKKQNKDLIEDKQKREEAAAKKAGDDAAKKATQQAKKDEERQTQKEAREKRQQLIKEKKDQAKEDLLYGGLTG